VQRSSGARSAPKQTAPARQGRCRPGLAKPPGYKGQSPCLVRIRVRDEGVGIAARHQPHIFEKFYRVDGDLAQTVKGVGLGLSLVQHIVHAHHGTVSVESREGAGSTFSIELMGAA
jgi:signal transduction histidine kinase